MARRPRPEISAEFRAQIEAVKGKRARIVLDHILKHGQVTTEDLTKRYGYQHPPRAIADVREAGIPLEKFDAEDSEGRRIAAYRFGDPAAVQGHKLDGRRVLPKGLAISLFASQVGRCAICGHEYERRYLQVDHRVPFKVGGDPPTSDETKFMMLCASCQRRKSWSCENCPNWTARAPATCGTCYWAQPDGHQHVATDPVRRMDLVLNGSDVVAFDRLRSHLGGDDALRIFVRNILRNSAPP